MDASMERASLQVVFGHHARSKRPARFRLDTGDVSARRQSARWSADLREALDANRRSVALHRYLFYGSFPSAERLDADARYTQSGLHALYELHRVGFCDLR